MKPAVLLKTLLPGLFLLFTVDRASAETVSLENRSMRITFDVSEGIRISSMSSSSLGADIIARNSRIPIYEIEIVRNGRSVTIDPGHAGRVSVSRPTPDSVRFLAQHPRENLDVACLVRLPEDSSQAVFSIEVLRGKTDSRIGLIRYPGYGIDISGIGGTPKVLLPIADGQLLTDPAGTMRDGEIRTYNYPGEASAQLMAVLNGRGGTVSYSTDGGGLFKRLSVRRYGKTLLTLFEHVTYQRDDAQIRLPYTVEVAFFEGGWENAADIYKQWAGKQKWCRTLLEDRRNSPVLSRPSFFLPVNIREMAGGESRSIDRSPDVPAVVESWNKALGIPITTVLLSWEKHGPWITPDYFPPYGGDEPFLRLTQRLRERGNAMIYLSGLNYTVRKTPRHGAGDFQADQGRLRDIEAAAIVDLDGRPHLEGQPEEGVGRRYVICPSTPVAESLLLDATRKAMALGVNMVQLDQVVGGGTPPCFSTRHGHPPGGGTTVYDAVSRILEGMTALARRQTPVGAISLEEPGELYIPAVDLFHTREYMERFWPRGQNGSLGVPLFTYLYHEYAAGYGGDSAPLTTNSENLDVAIHAQAMNLITGRMPAGAVWMNLIPIGTLQPALRKFIQDAASLMSGAAGRYLMFGRIVNLDDDGGRPRTVRFRVAGKSFDFPATSVMSRGFRLKDGSTGLLYINPTDRPQKTVLKFDAGGRKRTTAAIWPKAGVPMSSGEEYELPPRGILFLVMK